ncbi:MULTISPECIES: STAS-like domain-containing protein [Sphingobacterium]|uniref:STAS-like domain-containing protein n=1 Tax=Sphingobacterium TaxID=28453 RepID=UPI0006275F63|nr:MULTISPECIES: STAS-like domain-containing protein [unclassified Sphingobacterium]KKO92462.1 hypothetical protein AAW12_05015 [Sphingobacterium sp. Ag1]
MKVKVYDIIHSKNALLHDDGIMLFNEVKNVFNQQHKSIDVDFEGVNRLSTLFLNASFGKLLAEFGKEETEQSFHPVNYEHISSFKNKFLDMWDNFENRDNYQAYRDIEFA